MLGGRRKRAVSADDPQIFYSAVLCTLVFFFFSDREIFRVDWRRLPKTGVVQTRRFLCWSGWPDALTALQGLGSYILFSFSTFFYRSNEISVTPPSSATVKERAMRHRRPVFLISINPQQNKANRFLCPFFFVFQNRNWRTWPLVEV